MQERHGRQLYLLLRQRGHGHHHVVAVAHVRRPQRVARQVRQLRNFSVEEMRLHKKHCVLIGREGHFFTLLKEMGEKTEAGGLIEHVRVVSFIGRLLTHPVRSIAVSFPLKQVPSTGHLHPLASTMGRT